METPCSYYGEMDGKLHGDPASYFVVDMAYRRILDAHQEKLKKTYDKMISDLKKTFDEDIKNFNKKVLKLNERIDTLDEIIDLMKKEKSDASKEIDEQKIIQRKRKA